MSARNDAYHETISEAKRIQDNVTRVLIETPTGSTKYQLERDQEICTGDSSFELSRRAQIAKYCDDPDAGVNQQMRLHPIDLQDF